MIGINRDTKLERRAWSAEWGAWGGEVIAHFTFSIFTTEDREGRHGVTKLAINKLRKKNVVI